MKKLWFKKIILPLLIVLIFGAGFYFIINKNNVNEEPKDLVSYTDNIYNIGFTYPESWGEVEIMEGNIVCPEEDTYRTPETLSIFDKEFRFPDRDLKDTDSIIRSGIRVYHMNPTQTNNCNDELLRKLATKEIFGPELSSIQFSPISISDFYGVQNKRASRLDTESREQYTLFVEESSTSVLIIQPYMSFIPYADSPEWKEIDMNFENNILGYVEHGITSNQIREYLSRFREMAESLRINN